VLLAQTLVDEAGDNKQTAYQYLKNVIILSSAPMASTMRSPLPTLIERPLDITNKSPAANVRKGLLKQVPNYAVVLVAFAGLSLGIVLAITRKEYLVRKRIHRDRNNPYNHHPDDDDDDDEWLQQKNAINDSEDGSLSSGPKTLMPNNQDIRRDLGKKQVNESDATGRRVGVAPEQQQRKERIVPAVMARRTQMQIWEMEKRMRIERNREYPNDLYCEGGADHSTVSSLTMGYQGQYSFSSLPTSNVAAGDVANLGTNNGGAKGGMNNTTAALTLESRTNVLFVSQERSQQALETTCDDNGNVDNAASNNLAGDIDIINSTNCVFPLVGTAPVHTQPLESLPVSTGCGRFFAESSTGHNNTHVSDRVRQQLDRMKAVMNQTNCRRSPPLPSQPLSRENSNDLPSKKSLPLHLFPNSTGGKQKEEQAYDFDQQRSNNSFISDSSSSSLQYSSTTEVLDQQQQQEVQSTTNAAVSSLLLQKDINHNGKIADNLDVDLLEGEILLPLGQEVIVAQITETVPIATTTPLLINASRQLQRSPLHENIINRGDAQEDNDTLHYMSSVADTEASSCNFSALASNDNVNGFTHVNYTIPVIHKATPDFSKKWEDDELSDVNDNNDFLLNINNEAISNKIMSASNNASNSEICGNNDNHPYQLDIKHCNGRNTDIINGIETPHVSGIYLHNGGYIYDGDERSV